MSSVVESTPSFQISGNGNKTDNRVAVWLIIPLTTRRHMRLPISLLFYPYLRDLYSKKKHNFPLAQSNARFFLNVNTQIVMSLYQFFNRNYLPTN